MASNDEGYTAEDILFGTVILVLVIINVLGNALVVLVILKDRSMRTPVNHLLLNLAIADMMVGVFFLSSSPFKKTFTHPSGLAGDLLCKFLTGSCLGWMAEMASAFSLVFIAVERYYAVMHPLDFQRKLTISKIKILVSICWILSIVLNIPDFISKSYDEDHAVCDFEWQGPWQAKSYAFMWFTVGGAMPAVVMLVLYSKVIRSLWFQRKKIAPNVSRQAVLKSRKKISQTMLTVSVIYTLTCLPSHTLFMVDNFSTWEFPDLAQEVFKCLIVFNSAVNPFVYSLQSKQFNKSVKKLFDCNRSRRTGPTRGRENEPVKRTITKTLKRLPANTDALEQGKHNDDREPALIYTEFATSKF